MIYSIYSILSIIMRRYCSMISIINAYIDTIDDIILCSVYMTKYCIPWYRESDIYYYIHYDDIVMILTLYCILIDDDILYYDIFYDSNGMMIWYILKYTIF